MEYLDVGAPFGVDRDGLAARAWTLAHRFGIDLEEAVAEIALGLVEAHARAQAAGEIYAPAQALQWASTRALRLLRRRDHIGIKAAASNPHVVGVHAGGPARIDRDTRLALRTVIAQLPDRQRQLCALLEAGIVPVGDIPTVLGCSESTMYNDRRAIARMLREQGW